MSVTPQDFLDSAEVLAAIGTDEMHQRNAISRAYYAAYHRSCEVIEPDGVDRKLGSHRSYIEQLKEGGSNTLARRVGISLGVIYSERIRSDYKLYETIRPSDFSKLINRTKELFKELASPPPSTPASKSHWLKIIK